MGKKLSCVEILENELKLSKVGNYKIANIYTFVKCFFEILHFSESVLRSKKQIFPDINIILAVFFLFWKIQIRDRTLKSLCGKSHGFRKCWMRMYRRG